MLAIIALVPPRIRRLLLMPPSKGSDPPGWVRLSAGRSPHRGGLSSPHRRNATIYVSIAWKFERWPPRLVLHIHSTQASNPSIHISIRQHFSISLSISAHAVILPCPHTQLRSDRRKCIRSARTYPRPCSAPSRPVAPPVTFLRIHASSCSFCRTGTLLRLAHLHGGGAKAAFVHLICTSSTHTSHSHVP